jgi:CelD/BcsL family acetyltransferase involved in cellulose biosynthesis
MNVSVVRPQELGDAEIAAWRAMQRATPDLLNPFLSPGFTLAAARVRPETRVAVLEDDQKIVGFFPFERRRPRIALPVGAGVSDAQGIVHVRGLEWDPIDLLRGCKLDVWEFDHLLCAQISSVRRAARQRISIDSGFIACRNAPIIDVSQGYEKYAQAQRERSRRTFKSTLYKDRKLGRDVGPVRLNFDAHDPTALRLLLKWKSAQYRRTGRRDRFATGWIEQLVWDLVDHHIDGCRGTLTVLHAGERIAAVHLGLRSEQSLSCWFPAYDPDLARYSPGLVLTLRMARAAADAGLHHLDLGKGDERYKQSLKTGDLTMGEGAVYRPSAAAVLHGVRRVPVRYASNFVLSHQRLRRVARTTLARVGRLRSAA